MIVEREEDSELILFHDYLAVEDADGHCIGDLCLPREGCTLVRQEVDEGDSISEIVLDFGVGRLVGVLGEGWGGQVRKRRGGG
jgi:hypothetical protein